jgi:Uncharacterized conserved protein (COG2071)
MQLLKDIPVGYRARLKDIRLVNFSIHPNELQGYGARLPLVLINDRPVISLLNVTVSQLRPSFLFNTLHFTYRHIAFRLLIKDGNLHDDKVNRGIYYWKSFTNSSFIARAGRMFTNFNFEKAYIENSQQQFLLKKDNQFLRYTLDDQPVQDNNNLRETFVNIDRAYSLHQQQVKMTKVRRNDLPLEPLNCTGLATNFFKTAEFICAFQVKNVLEYEWLPPRNSLLQHANNPLAVELV